MTTAEKFLIGFVVLFWIALGVAYVEASWTVRKYEHRLSPLEQHLLMRYRKRRVMRRMRQITRDHTEGR